MILFFFSSVSSLHVSAESQANDNNQSELTITFENGRENNQQKANKNDWVSVDEEKPKGRLPQLGEMVMSLILMLIGVSMGIILIGLYFIKQLFDTSDLRLYE